MTVAVGEWIDKGSFDDRKTHAGGADRKRSSGAQAGDRTAVDLIYRTSYD